MNIKNLIITTAIVAAMIGGVSYAFAEDAPVAPACKIANFTETVTRLTEGGAVVTPISQGEIDKLVEAKGPPPGAEGQPFTVDRIDENDFSALIVVIGDCIVDKVGPVPAQMIDNVLGSVRG